MYTECTSQVYIHVWREEIEPVIFKYFWLKVGSGRHHEGERRSWEPF